MLMLGGREPTVYSIYMDKMLYGIQYYIYM
jgi:hypothetical protein